MSGLQFVWWPSPSEWHLGWGEANGGLRRIYRWYLWLGPLEIRRWN